MGCLPRTNPLASPTRLPSRTRRDVCLNPKLIGWCKRPRSTEMRMRPTSRRSKPNGLENYCFTMRNTLTEEKLKDKFESGDKEKIERAVQDALDWLDKNQL